MTSPHLHTLLARARIDDLRQATDPLAHKAERPLEPAGDVMLRLASASDETSLTRLAALDSSRPPVAPALLALLNGEPVAALSIVDGTYVSDPFRRTAELIDLLRARACQLRGDARNSRSRATLRRVTTRTSAAHPRGAASNPAEPPPTFPIHLSPCVAFST